LGLTHNGEVLIINPQSWKLVYRGAAEQGGNQYVAGAPIWSSPTIDEARGLIYVGTGNSYAGPAAAGASMPGPGPVIVDGMLYVSSGYGAFGGRAGNVLLAYGLD
jgi:hypothetical protein